MASKSAAKQPFASKNQASSTTMLVRACIGPFDIRSPPIKKRKVAGHLVPTLITAMRFLNVKRRRITIEILSPGSSASALPQEAARPWDPENEVLNDQDRVIFRIYRLSRKNEHGDNGIEAKDSTGGDEDDDISVSTLESTDDDGVTSGKVWREHRQFPSNDVEITKFSGKVIEVMLGAGHETVVRDLRFESPQEAMRFREALERIKSLESERAARQIAKYRATKQIAGGGTPKTHGASPSGVGNEIVQSPMSASETIAEGDDEDEEQINLLVEIVSAKDLPIADIVSTDAYIVVRMKGKEIHRTQVISKNLSPIWTLETGSLFLIQMTPEDFFASTSGLSFTVKDFDTLGSNDVLGSVNVSLDELLAGTGKRTGFEIVPAGDAPKTPSEKKGMLYLRFKKATQDDIEFMQAYRARSKKFGMYADETFLPIRKPDTKFLRRQEKKGANKEVLHRVRPFPDPNRPEDDTKWMTKEQIHAEALKQSARWVEAGSGDIGKLYLEVIGCDKLPNMDTATLNFRDKTDAFACIVFEDCIVNTDVIGDSLSPRWMPWCHRAFVFNISHPSSDIFLGIFDHDPELSPLQLVSRATSNLHDPIGRLVINVSNFRPGTLYLLQYPIYFGELKEHRKAPRGTVTLRLRLEFPDMRKAMIRGVMPPPPASVSVARHTDFEVAHYTTDGIVDDRPFSLKTLTRYIEELQSHKMIVDSLQEAAMVVWLWRGHYRVDVAGKSFNLPLHSMTAFTWGMLVTWNWNRLPAFWAFCVGWIMLATNEQVRQHPSRWHNCPSYYEFIQRLLSNTASSETIAADTNLEAIIAYEKRVDDQQKRRAVEKQKEEEQELALQDELGREIEKAEAAEQMGGKDGGFAGGWVENPLKPVLYPIQKKLRKAVSAVRIAKSVILWNEAYYAFWIVTACFLVSAIALWIPWAFILRWLFRILVFVGLGPWMAVVDRNYFKTNPEMSNEERDEALRHRLRSRYEEVLQSATNYFQRKERALKLSSMNKYMFGKWIVRVPRFSEDLYDDIPLASSSCAPVDPDSVGPIRVEQVKFGQTLKGDMIPKRAIQVAVVDSKKKHSGMKEMNPFLLLKDVVPENVPLLGSGSAPKTSSGYDSVAASQKTS